jgi:hypothetical protein
MTKTCSTRLIALACLGLVVEWATASAATPSACGILCGGWQLDAAVSDALQPQLEAAFQHYKEPQPKRLKRTNSSDVATMAQEELDATLGPSVRRPPREELRAELVRILTSPTNLTMAAKGDNILIASGSTSARQLTPGEPHARVDSEGTARIRCEWLQNRLVVTETYDRRRQSRETYELQPRGIMVITRSVERPGLPTIKLRSVYRRA